MRAINLSPESLGTLRALGTLKRLHRWDPLTEWELVQQGYARRSFGELHITMVGERAYRQAVADEDRFRPARMKASPRRHG